MSRNIINISPQDIVGLDGFMLKKTFDGDLMSTIEDI